MRAAVPPKFAATIEPRSTVPWARKPKFAVDSVGAC
jgi:hypothetical protein